MTTNRKALHILILVRNFLFILLIFVMLIFYKMKNFQYDYIRDSFHSSALKYIDFKEDKYNPLQPHVIKKLITDNNCDERILNLEKFGPINATTPVMVIFVDTYNTTFNYLLASLYEVKGIDGVLIIFSHSHFDENVNTLINTVDFARVIQIFYPYSLQLYPKQFPVVEADGCRTKGDASEEIVEHVMADNSSGTNDKFRDTALANDKNFWWWTVNHVFEKLSYTMRHKGLFMFLDDDLFVMEDFLYMALQMKKLCDMFLSKCDFVSLGSADEPKFYGRSTSSAEVKIWEQEEDSVAIAFDSDFWNTLAKQYYMFCDIGDYSWSHTLLYLSTAGYYGEKFKVISTSLPRAYITNKLTTVTDSITELKIIDTVFKILEIQKRNYGRFYPSCMDVFYKIELTYPNGNIPLKDVDFENGFDSRDKQLCFNMTIDKLKM